MCDCFHCLLFQCVEILSAVFYYVSYDFKSRPALMTARAAPLIALIIDQEPSVRD